MANFTANAISKTDVIGIIANIKDNICELLVTVFHCGYYLPQNKYKKEVQINGKAIKDIIADEVKTISDDTFEITYNF